MLEDPDQLPESTRRAEGQGGGAMRGLALVLLLASSCECVPVITDPECAVQCGEMSRKVYWHSHDFYWDCVRAKCAGPKPRFQPTGM